MSFAYPIPTPVYPTVPNGYPSTIKPIFSTGVNTSVSGFETRYSRQAYPLWEFSISYERLADQTQNIVPDPYYIGETQLQQVAGLFLQVNGQYGRFYYSCPEDCSRRNQGIAIGDNTTGTYTVVRTWGNDAAPFVEPVGGVDETNPLTVYIDGSPISSSDYSFVDNQIILTSNLGTGAVLTMDFFFFYFCRFLEDISDYEQFVHHLWQMQSLKFRSAKR